MLRAVPGRSGITLGRAAKADSSPVSRLWKTLFEAPRSKAGSESFWFIEPAAAQNWKLVLRSEVRQLLDWAEPAALRWFAQVSKGRRHPQCPRQRELLIAAVPTCPAGRARLARSGPACPLAYNPSVCRRPSARSRLQRTDQHQANLPTQEALPSAHPRLSRADGHPERATHHRESPPQEPEPTRGFLRPCFDRQLVRRVHPDRD